MFGKRAISVFSGNCLTINVPVASRSTLRSKKQVSLITPGGTSTNFRTSGKLRLKTARSLSSSSRCCCSLLASCMFGRSCAAFPKAFKLANRWPSARVSVAARAEATYDPNNSCRPCSSEACARLNANFKDWLSRLYMHIGRGGNRCHRNNQQGSGQTKCGNDRVLAIPSPGLF